MGKVFEKQKLLGEKTNLEGVEEKTKRVVTEEKTKLEVFGEVTERTMMEMEG
jgi:hypothetical protein